MAEFSLGLTKTAVEGTLSLVKLAVEEEKKLRDKVQNDLVFISGELEMMQSFLRVANNNNNKNDDQVVTRVRQLRNLAFDVEDCIEYVVHLDLDKPSHWGWLQRVWQTVNCHAPPLPLDDAVAEIKQLKARVEDVSQRGTRYNLHDSNNNNNQQHAAVTAVMPPPLAEQPPDATTYPSSSPAPAFHILRDAWEATGKWCSKNMCNLQELIVSGDDGLQVISVWGSTSADLGTASIFRKAFCDPVICQEFRCRAWVKLTHPLNHDEFVKSLLTQFGASSQQSNADVCLWTKIKDFWTRMKIEVTQDNHIKVKAKIMQQMRRQRYLVVLEDVFTLEEWAVIRMYLPDNKNGSRIVVSTPQLGIALLCAGEPYQVSELTKFHGDNNRFLCAFVQNKMPSGEFYRQLRRHRVISMWGADGDDKSNLVGILYKGIINGWFKAFEGVLDADKADRVDMLRKATRSKMKHDGVEFEQHSWVDVPHPFDLKVFARRLFLNFHSDNIRASEMRKGGMMEKADLVKWCRESLFEKKDCLMVINGLKSMIDWECITSNFFLSSNNAAAAKAAAGCIIIVVTNEETVARQCVKDHKYQAFNVKDLEADTCIATLINKGSWYYGVIRGIKGSRLLYDRRKDAIEWTSKFKTVGGNNPDEEEFGVFTVHEDLYDITATGILRHAHFRHAFQQIKRRSWVDVPSFFDLMDFSWRLLLDFYSDDPQTKEAVAVGLMEGTIIDPIQKCREFLRNEKCLVVIHGLTSTTHWDSIKDTFLSDSEHIQSIIIVSSFDRRINAYCSPKELRLGSQQQGFTDNFNKEFRSSFYTERCQKAWAQLVEPPVGRDWEIMDLTRGVRLSRGLWSVWGIVGVGKSTLVRTVYYKEILRSASPTYLFSKCFEAFGWVDVPSPFDLTGFAWRLLLDLYSDHPQAKQTATITSMTEEGQYPILECCKILREISCFVVIDGMCSTQDWDLIKATFLAEPINQGTTIVVITNEEKVAMHCVQNDKECVLNVRRLEADAALNLFQKIALEPIQPRDVERSKSIVAKCGGLPKVVATIGEVCIRPGRIWLLEYLNDNNFMGTLETDPEFHGLRPLFSWMQSYFDACSDSLKPCIFYLSIFSAEKNIRLRRLLWRWIAEGYCRDTSDGTTCEENGEKFISELVNLSIIQESASSNVFCQINGFFHEYIISRPMEDNLVFALEGRCSLNSTRGGQHLTIRSGWDRNEIVYESIDFSRLRSLTVFGKWESFFISNNKKVNMRLLRVLDLEDATYVTNEDLEQIAKQLPRLKFLSLRRCREITRLPSSIGGLRRLQTLDIRHTSIVTLPLFITRLEKLRYLRAGTTEAWDWEGDVLLLPAADGEDRASSSAAAQVTNLAATAATAATTTTTIEGGRDDSMSSSSSAQGATPTVGGTNSTTPVVLAPETGNNRPRAPTLVFSFLSNFCRHGGGGVDNNNNARAAGVTVPADIGKLTVLQTLGVVRVNAQCGNKAIFQELKKLTQLRKLGVSGINKGNIKEFCSAISGHAHLKSLSVELDKDYPANLDDITQLVEPEDLNLSIWRKLKLDMTLANPEEFPNLEDADKKLFVHHLRIRPIQGGELHIGPCWREARAIEIQCNSVLHIKFDGRNDVCWRVEVLKVHFSAGSQSSLQISGLSNLKILKEVWLMGYSDEHMQDMQRQINEMTLRARPMLKLVQPRSSS